MIWSFLKTARFKVTNPGGFRDVYIYRCRGDAEKRQTLCCVIYGWDFECKRYRTFAPIVDDIRLVYARKDKA